MKILIMAAGRGERYRREGFTISKPLIQYGGRAMIDHVIDQVPLDQCSIGTDDIIVVGTKEVCEYIDRIYSGTITTVEVLNTQNGPGMSALLAGGYIGQDESVVLMDSDSIVGYQATEDVVFTDGNVVLVRDHDGVTTAFSTVSVDDGLVSDIQEKTGHSYTICVGMYKYARWSDFVTSVCKLRFSSDKEVYLSAVMADLLLIGEEIKAVSTDEDWINLGTPGDLMKANKHAS